MKVLAGNISVNNISFQRCVRASRSALQIAICCCAIMAAKGQCEAQSGTAGDAWSRPSSSPTPASIYAAPNPSRQAIGRYSRVLQMSRELKDRNGEGAVLTRLGSAHLSLAQYDAAIEHYEQALAIQRELKQQREEGITLNHLGNAHFYLKRYETAVGFYEQALVLRRAVQDRAGEGITLSNLALASQALGRYEAARVQAEQALATAREVKDRESEGNALNEAGSILLSQQCYPEAIQQLQQALVILREVGARAAEARALHNLMLAWKAQGKANLAVFYGKQAVNVTQEIRADIQNLDKDLQKGFVTSKQDSYRELADLLIEQERLPEAQQVLNMLKEEEYFQFTRSDS